MTESEAKTKWCPMARLSDGSTSFNRYLEGIAPSQASCLGSECTCWVWDEERNIVVAVEIPEMKVQKEIEKQSMDKLVFVSKRLVGKRHHVDAPDESIHNLFFEKE